MALLRLPAKQVCVKAMRVRIPCLPLKTFNSMDIKNIIRSSSSTVYLEVEYRGLRLVRNTVYYTVDADNDQVVVRGKDYYGNRHVVTLYGNIEYIGDISDYLGSIPVGYSPEDLANMSEGLKSLVSFFQTIRPNTSIVSDLYIDDYDSGVKPLLGGDNSGNFYLPTINITNSQGSVPSAQDKLRLSLFSYKKELIGYLEYEITSDLSIVTAPSDSFISSSVKKPNGTNISVSSMSDVFDSDSINFTYVKNVGGFELEVHKEVLSGYLGFVKRVEDKTLFDSTLYLTLDVISKDNEEKQYQFSIPEVTYGINLGTIEVDKNYGGNVVRSYDFIDLEAKTSLFPLKYLDRNYGKDIQTKIQDGLLSNSGWGEINYISKGLNDFPQFLEHYFVVLDGLDKIIWLRKTDDNAILFEDRYTIQVIDPQDSNFSNSSSKVYNYKYGFSPLTLVISTPTYLYTLEYDEGTETWSKSSNTFAHDCSTLFDFLPNGSKPVLWHQGAVAGDWGAYVADSGSFDDLSTLSLHTISSGSVLFTYPWISGQVSGFPTINGFNYDNESIDTLTYDGSSQYGLTSVDLIKTGINLPTSVYNSGKYVMYRSVTEGKNFIYFDPTLSGQAKIQLMNIASYHESCGPCTF